MIRRRKTLELIELIDSNPAVALLGPRQVGKTTLALEIGEQRPSIYLDLESETKAKLSEPDGRAKLQHTQCRSRQSTDIKLYPLS